MQHKKKYLFICLMAAFCIVLCLVFRYDTVRSDIGPHAVTITENTIGTLNGIDFELWKDQGDAKMIVYDAGKYECEWEDSHDAVFRIGRKSYPARPISSFGEIKLIYDADYQPDGNSYLGAYGWMTEPLVEYYIIENWGGTHPGTQKNLTWLGTCTIDGIEYDLYSALRKNKPYALGEGTATFMQYWSVRRAPASAGTIRLKAHFRAWEDAGLSPGDIYEISFAVEGLYSNGRAAVRLGADFWREVAG